MTKIQTEKQKTRDIHMKSSKHVTTTSNANTKAKDKRIPSTTEKSHTPKTQETEKNVKRQQIQKHYSTSRFRTTSKRCTTQSSSSESEMSYSDSSKQSNRYQLHSSHTVKRSKTMESTPRFSHKTTSFPSYKHADKRNYSTTRNVFFHSKWIN